MQNQNVVKFAVNAMGAPFGAYHIETKESGVFVRRAKSAKAKEVIEAELAGARQVDYEEMRPFGL